MTSKIIYKYEIIVWEKKMHDVHQCMRVPMLDVRVSILDGACGLNLELLHRHPCI